MRLRVRVLALISTALVLFTGLAPGLERCGSHGAPGAGPDAMAGHMMEMPHHGPATAAGAAWTVPPAGADAHSICCLFMSTCSTHCFVAGGGAMIRDAGLPAAASQALALSLASILRPPESPPPRA